MKKIFAIVTIASAVGIAYALYTLKDLPDAFDFNLNEEEDND
jgi:hypothetical protein